MSPALMVPFLKFTIIEKLNAPIAKKDGCPASLWLALREINEIIFKFKLFIPSYAI